MDEYRIRWAVVQHCNGYAYHPATMCIAERRVRFLGIRFWWPTRTSEWRDTEAKAVADIVEDARLRLPLPAPQIVRVDEREGDMG